MNGKGNSLNNTMSKSNADVIVYYEGNAKKVC